MKRAKFPRDPEDLPYNRRNVKTPASGRAPLARTARAPDPVGNIIGGTVIVGFVALLVVGTMMAMNSPGGGTVPVRSSDDQIRIESFCWGLAEEQGIPWSERNDFVDECSR